MINARVFLILAFVVQLPRSADAQVSAPRRAAQSVTRTTPFDIPLYEGIPPGSMPTVSDSDVYRPTRDQPFGLLLHVARPRIRVYLPPRWKSSRPAVVIYPGGGYRVLAYDHEGDRIAQWLNSIGVAAIVCTYRVSERSNTGYRFPAPLLDARQALRLVRANAAAWGIDPHRVGVMGFSAGGHLASMMLTMGDVELPGDHQDGHDVRPRIPDFGALIYPVISMNDSSGHRGSADALLGDSADADMRRNYSTYLRVSGATPPTFLVATRDDDAVPMQNAIAFDSAMRKNSAPSELHVWERGGHGFGTLASAGAVSREWPERFAVWMRALGLLEPKRP
jgi:acetyl esterase/lipase